LTNEDVTPYPAYPAYPGRGIASDEAEDTTLEQAGLIWSDEVRGVEGNFFGLTDEEGRTIQFYFTSGIPDDVDDAEHLEIVLMDFPMPELRGSYAAQVTIGAVHGLIEKVFQVGADPKKFPSVTFQPW
jgi:hypothetical protein